MGGEMLAARAEINLEAARENVKIIRKISGASVLAVVKADAYAHGAAAVAPAFLKAGASRLCVASPGEGIDLRDSGMESPVIVLNPAEPRDTEAMAEYGLMPVIGDIKTAERFSRAGKNLKNSQKIHIEIDTGMGRSGFLPDETLQSVKKIAGMDNIEIEGIFTHFSCADEEDPDFTEEQIKKFKKASIEIEAEGIVIPCKHTSNSAGIMAFPHDAANAVRPGLLLYGISPFADKSPPTKPVMTLKTRIINIRKLPPGSPLSYGRTYKTAAESVIATLAIGYADGYDRRLSNRANVLINGKRAPIAGRICMDRCLADITGIPAKTGDEAILVGTQGKETISVEELSQICGTVPNEFVSRLGKRIQRLYLEK